MTLPSDDRCGAEQVSVRCCLRVTHDWAACHDVAAASIDPALVTPAKPARIARAHVL